MASVQESLEPKEIETESIIQECATRIRQALETENIKIKETAERDARQIIARAKEAAVKTITQSKQEAEVESARIITRAKEEADKILRVSREESAENRQESARIIGETRDKISQIIIEGIEREIAKVQNEFAQAISDVKYQTSLVLSQLTKSIEQIVDEKHTNIKPEFENSIVSLVKTETNLKQIIEIPDKESDLSSQQITDETITQTVSASKKKKEDITSFEEGQTPKYETDSTRYFERSLKFEIIPPFNQERLERMPEWLARLPGLKVLSTGGYAGSNRWITTYTVDLQKPLPLLKIIKSDPHVEDVTERKGNVMIRLK